MIEVTRISTIYFNDKFIHVVIEDNSFIDYEDVVDINLKIQVLRKKKRYLRLIDIRAKCFFDPKAMRFMESKTAKFKMIGQAIIIGPNTRQEVINFFSEMNCNRMPTKFFIDFDSAKEWLVSLKYDKSLRARLSL